MIIPAIPLPGCPGVTLSRVGILSGPVDWRAVRQDLDMTQGELAEACMLSNRAVTCQWESGATQPSAQAMRALYRYLTSRRGARSRHM